MSGLLLLLPVTAVVPIHGVVQFSAGASRLIAYRTFINWSVVTPFICGMIPGALIGCYALSLLRQLNASLLLIAIACVIAYSLLSNHKEKTASAVTPRSDKPKLVGLGFCCGLLGMFVGSTGPLVSGSLLKRGVLKEAHIASKSLMQGSAHLIKIPLFAIGLDFDFGPYLWALAAMVSMVFVGTWAGKWCLSRLSSERFSTTVKCLLLIIVAKIMWTELPKLVQTF